MKYKTIPLYDIQLEFNIIQNVQAKVYFSKGVISCPSINFALKFHTIQYNSFVQTPIV